MLTFLKINCFRTFPATHLLFANTRFFLYTHDELVGVKPPAVTVTWSHVIQGPIEEFYDLSFFHSLATLLKSVYEFKKIPLESCDENIPLSPSSLFKFTFRLATFSCPFSKGKQA